jgi:hypothetical protein
VRASQLTTDDCRFSAPPPAATLESCDSLIVIGQNEANVLELRGELFVTVF